MEAWNETVKAALLGTARNGWSEAALPAEIKDTFDAIDSGSDSEGKFLAAAALVMNYTKAGKLTPVIPALNASKADADSRDACTRKAADLFVTTLTEGRRDLTSLWLHTCNQQGKRVPHWLLPQLLDLGVPNEHLQEDVIAVADARGRWIAQYNPAWKYALPLNVNETWSTGKPAERYQLLERLRKDDPAKARELLASTWKQENTAHRADFVLLLEENISAGDIPFLEELLNDKSQKVRSEVKHMLRSLEGSSINAAAWERLKQNVEIKTTRAGNKELSLKKITPQDKELLSAGSEKDSDNTVSLKDEERWYFHMVSSIDPKKWEEHYKLTAKEMIGMLGETKKAQKLLPAFAQAAHRSKNIEWARELLSAGVSANAARLMQLLPFSEREKAYRDSMEDDISVVNDAFEDAPYHQWSIDFTRYVIRLSSADAYRFRKEWYRTTTLHFHTDIIKELDKHGPSDIAMKSFWQGISQEIVQTIELRQAITHSLK